MLMVLRRGIQDRGLKRYGKPLSRIIIKSYFKPLPDFFINFEYEMSIKML